MRIKELREEKNLSQRQLASFLNVAQTTLSGWENGNREPDIKALKSMASFFEVSIDFLVSQPGERFNNLTLTNEEKLILQKASDIIKRKLK